MPLHDMTANNSGLEAMDCALSLMAPDIGSSRDYICDKGVVMTPPKGASLARQISSMLDDTHRC